MLNPERFGISRFVTVAFGLVLFSFVALPVQAQYSVIHNFAGAPNDGAWANGDLAADTIGNLYGTTVLGGANNYGTIFKIDSTGATTILYSFTYGLDGAYPLGGLLLDADGTLYGTASVAGRNGSGTVFKLDTNGTLVPLFSFGLGQSGASPHSRLVTLNGNLYGVASSGGSSGCEGGCGIIYEVTKSGKQTILYRFTGGVDGARPQGLFRDSAGNFYGVATLDTGSGGTVFKLDTAAVFSILYTFTGGIDGGQPTGRVIRDNNGNIHGVTFVGGDTTCDCGVVFRVDANGRESLLHKFFGHGGGAKPEVGLLDLSGVLYGTTVSGGLACGFPGGCGTLYQIGKTGNYKVLHSFGGPKAGDGYANVSGSLIRGQDGGIYGATYQGGTGTSCTNGVTEGCGTIFKYTP
ncbi:MAG TPA: choice-of-anchor tandem repeat GloVer-containing protein [Verrucomicrobiae bacterium]|nr:choice-of-anchor tandem repeat GloVer-containing protein [Verrucomicrobiae bacterium]